jgi:hypothetical protein
MQFETSSRKQYEVGEFYSHFKTCLPKIAMISNGVRGHSNDDTFDRGEVCTLKMPRFVYKKRRFVLIFVLILSFELCLNSFYFQCSS